MTANIGSPARRDWRGIMRSMNIRFDYRHAEACCFIELSGSLGLVDFRNAFLRAWDNPDYTDAVTAVWDLTGVQFRFDKEDVKSLRARANQNRPPSGSQLATLAAKDLVEFTRQRRPQNLPSRVALVAASDLDFGMMRIYSGYIDFEDVEMDVFRNIDEARAWLG